MLRRYLGRTSFGSPRTIGFRIAALVAAIVLPLLVLIVWLAVTMAAAKREVIERHRTEVTENVTARVDREIAEMFGLLTGLAVSDDIQKGDYSSFQKQAETLIAGTRLEKCWLFRRDGSVIATAGPVDPANAASALPAGLVADVFKGERAVSNVRLDGADRASVVLAVRTAGGSEHALGLAGEMPIQHLSAVFAAAGMPEHWGAAIVDRNGNYVARSLDAGRRLGQSARPTVVAVAKSSASTGVFQNTTYEGVPMLNSYVRSPLTGWMTAVAVPVALINALYRKYLALVLLGSFGLILLSMGLTYMYAARISEPVRELGQMARAIATGRPYAKPRSTLTELVEVQQAFETATVESSHLAALIASSADAIISIALDGTVLSWNAAAEDLFEFTADEIVGQSKELIVPGDKLEDFERQLKRVGSGDILRFETVRKNKSGERIDVSVSSAPIRRPDGEIVAISSIIHDITARVATEQHIEFLMRELAHRSKNQLAVIQSIAGQTARGADSKEEFLDQFRRRLQGLSASQTLLLSRDWQGAPLADVIRNHLSVFEGGNPERVSFEGPNIDLKAPAVEAIGLALHELATNAMKYGALSVPGGSVRIAWRQMKDEPSRPWLLTWQECNGPAVTPPTHQGFGSQVIKRLVSASVGGEAEIEYAPDGLRWRLTLPAEMVSHVSGSGRLTHAQSV